WYTPQSFYPVRIGDVIHSKYQVLYKLGFGTTATVWMCRDLHRDAYVCMKSMVCGYSSVKREVRAYELLKKAGQATKLPGKQYVRQALDHFELHHDDRIYHFLIHEPLGMSLETFMEGCGGSFPVGYVKELTIQMLQALEFIHSAEVVHADIQPSNILLHIQDETVFKEAEEKEMQHPTERKISEETVIFGTMDLEATLRRWIGPNSKPVLCDFGEARTGNLKDGYVEHIQPAQYRAPEVFLYLPWGEFVDIWNLGCMVWHMMLGRHLFPQTDADERTREKDQLARMVALLGPPPDTLLKDSGPRALEFFNEDGSFKGDVPNETLETFLASSLEHGKCEITAEESEAFLAFMRRTLTWTEVTRSSASDLLKDSWLGN
ncbi:putative CDK4/6, partial [Pholiota conissans]